MLFTSKFDLTVDAKQRVAIPARIRNKLNPLTDGDGFYIIRGANGALWLWTEQAFEQMAGKREPTLAPTAALMVFDAMTFPNAEHLEIDSAGRVRLPQELIEIAGLGSKVVLAGMRDHLELWDPTRWTEHQRANAERWPEVVKEARPQLDDT